MAVIFTTSDHHDHQHWIGRYAASDIVASHPSISSRHCCISVERVKVSGEENKHSNIISQPSSQDDHTTSNSQVLSCDSQQSNEGVKVARYVIKCKITDHSSNGTWIKRRTNDKIIKLKPNEATKITIGDAVHLLAPSHKDNPSFRYTLQKGMNNGELLLSKLLMTQSPVNERKRTRSDERGDTATNDVVQKKPKDDANESSLDCLEQCPSCMNVFGVIDLIEHIKECNQDIPRKSIELGLCIHCFDKYPITELVHHVELCPKNEIITNKEPIERCMKCFCDFPLSDLINHSDNCTGDMLGTSDRFKTFLPSAHDVDALALSVLSHTQQRAVEYVLQRSKIEASKKYPDLCMKVIELGYTPKDLQKVLQWVSNSAPIIIHVNLERVLHHFVKDTHYRNVFEIGHSGGSSVLGSRVSWEDNIFNKIYHDSPPTERVKYGVLNIVGDPNGVSCCYSYGDSFLQLKKVRLRTTFASMDTSSSVVKLSCCEHYGNVLHEYSDTELKAILDVATQRKPYLKSTMITHYKEVQIHGPVSFADNIDCIVVNHRYRGNHKIEKLLNEFITKNNCNLIWMNRGSAEGSLHHHGIEYDYDYNDYDYDDYSDDYYSDDDYDYY